MRAFLMILTMMVLNNHFLQNINSSATDAAETEEEQRLALALTPQSIRDRE